MRNDGIAEGFCAEKVNIVRKKRKLWERISTEAEEKTVKFLEVVSKERSTWMRNKYTKYFSSFSGSFCVQYDDVI